MPSLSNDVINWPKKKKEQLHSPTGVEFFGRELEELRVGLGRGECQEGGKKERKGEKEGGLPACWSVRATPTLSFGCWVIDGINRAHFHPRDSWSLVWFGAAAGVFECYNQPITHDDHHQFLEKIPTELLLAISLDSTQPLLDLQKNKKRIL